MSTNELGREIRRLLGDRSQTWLAEQIGTTQATVSRIVRGVHRPTPDKLVALARALHVDGTYLLQLAGYPITQAPDRHPEIDYLARRLYELPDYARRPIIDAVAAMVDAAHELSRAHAYHGGTLVDSAALYDVAPQEEARPSDAALVEEIIGELGQHACSTLHPSRHAAIIVAARQPCVDRGTRGAEHWRALHAPAAPSS